MVKHDRQRKASRKLRDGWNEKFKKERTSTGRLLLPDDLVNDFDDTEWTWDSAKQVDCGVRIRDQR